jgi:hypothetical protein
MKIGGRRLFWTMLALLPVLANAAVVEPAADLRDFAVRE